MDETMQRGEELLEEARAILAEAQKCRDEAKWCRKEARNAMNIARETLGKMLLPEAKKEWVDVKLPLMAEPFETYDVGEGAYLIYHARSSREEFEAYGKGLLDLGFAKHATYGEGTLLTQTYCNEVAVVNISIAENENILRVVVDPAGMTALPATEPVAQGDLPVIFRQENDLFEQVDCGMSYIFRLSDGKFFIIDGGWNTPGIANRLVEHLERLADGKKPCIAGWIFTHAHIDHIGTFFDFADCFADRVVLESVIYSFPGIVSLAQMGDEFVAPFVRRFRNAIAKFGDVTVYKARTGQQYHFAGFELDMLFTFEDYKMPHPLHNFNDTSLIFRVRTGGQTFMFLGDMAESGAPILAARYGELLRSDIVQVAHHGYAGGTDQVYDLIQAPIVLWPVPAAAPSGASRYANPEWSPVTRRMVQNYAKSVYVTCEGPLETELPLK